MMKDEAEILKELEVLDDALRSFPATAHWYCPRRTDDDDIDYDDLQSASDDMGESEKRDLISDWKERQSVAYKYSIVLGLDQEIVGEMLPNYQRRQYELLSSCATCLRNYHMGRKAYLRELRDIFDDEDQAEALADRLLQVDYQRIDNGLLSAQKLFEAAAPSARSQKLLLRNDPSALLALFEALCCPEYHGSEGRLSKYFNYVFEQLQVSRELKIQDMVPAMASFLFSEDPVRLKFARKSWPVNQSMLNTQKFDWIVHDPLTRVISLCQSPTPAYLDSLWSGVLLILEKMDKDLITHSLRGMEVQPSIFNLLLDHTGTNSPKILQLLIQCMHRLIQKAPQAFWSALGSNGSVSASTVAELIFRSPGYHTLLNEETFDSLESSVAINWIPDFLQSLAAIHRVEACASLVNGFFRQLQAPSFSESARTGSFYAGLNAINITLRTFNEHTYVINPSNSFIGINHILTLVDDHKVTIMHAAALPESAAKTRELKFAALRVLGSVLELDCKAVAAEHGFLKRNQAVERTPRTHSQSIWDEVLKVFQPGDLQVAKSILPALYGVTGVEELLPENKRMAHKMPKAHVDFNTDYRELMDNISRVFSRLSDFSASELQQLCQSNAAVALFSGVLSSHSDTYDSAIEVIKTMTDEISIDDAFSALANQAPEIFLRCYNIIIPRIRAAQNFAPMPNVIKTSGKVLKAFCGSTGSLRSRTDLSTGERDVVHSWWTNQWRMLDMVFAKLEAWSPRVNKPTEYMQDFCRDAMDYAEALFDNYNIVVTALRDTNTKDEKSSISKVLEVVCQNINGLVMLLRLRDTYLIGQVTTFLAKLLRSLGKSDLEVDSATADFIMDACKREGETGYRRTNLTNQQKAELQRVLTEHQGVEMIEITRVAKINSYQQSSLNSWAKSAFSNNESKLPSSVTMSKPTMPGRVTAQPNSTASFLQKEREQAQAARAAQIAKASKKNDDFLNKRKQAEAEIQRQKAEAVAAAKALRRPTGVPGAGSGLTGLAGAHGKDHTPVRSEIMVGSSDEESSDEEAGGSLLPVSGRAGPSKARTDYEESKRRAMQQQPVKKAKIQRSAKDLRARVEPNMDALYLEILNWNLFHDGDEPPSDLTCQKIADKFFDPTLYKQTFMPLLISEVWRSLVTARDENQNKPLEVTVLNRLSVDKFMEVSANMPMTQNRDLRFNERDIVLLSLSKDPMANPKDANCLARVDRTNKKKDVIELTFRISRNIEQDFLAALSPKSTIYAVKIADMTTTQREYAALSSLEYYDLCMEVLEAKPSPILNQNEEMTKGIISRYSLNRGQAKAILSAVENDGFTLVQGPPGTGKTKTIVSMVGAIMTKTLQQQQQGTARPAVNGQQKSSVPMLKKLLICAPSNAAVDELVVRLKDGVLPLSGPHQKINVIRLGRSDAINDNVKDVMLDELVQRKLDGGEGDKNKILKDRDALHQEAGKVKERLTIVRAQLDVARNENDKMTEQRLQREFDVLKRQQAHIGSKIDADKESGNTVSRQNEIDRRRFQQEILDGAHVICATLSGSGHDMFRNLNVEFETVIIDEAAQCIELSALIPLKYGANKCILVGDPEQLPPTVLSRSAQSFGYEQSLFVRMQKNHPNDVHLLDTQYRMHPEISRFPSEQFYHGKLLDGPEMSKLRDQPWHESATLGPYRFFDVEGIQTKEARGHSFINVPELNAAMKLYARLKSDYRSIDFKGKIGIIATYKAQLIELKKRFVQSYGEAIFEEIEFNTTDAFQGREREIIIFSCVRATQSGGIGFLKDIRRMNVGLTRAKSSLWVLGDSRSLKQGEFWNKLIEDSKLRDRYTGGNVLSLLDRPTVKDRKPPSVQASSLQPRRDSTVPQQPLSRKTSVDQIKPEIEQKLKSENSSRRSSGVDVEMTDAGAIRAPNAQGKRLGSDLTKDENKRPKTESPKAQSAVPDLSAQLAARQAARPAVPTGHNPVPVRPPVMRRKPPADPFLRKKKPPPPPR